MYLDVTQQVPPMMSVWMRESSFVFRWHLWSKFKACIEQKILCSVSGNIGFDSAENESSESMEVIQFIYQSTR